MATPKAESLVDLTPVAGEIYKGLIKMYHENICTDFEIYVGHKIFRCHKIVLAAISDYFKALFSSGMRETEQNIVMFDDINPETLEIFFQLLYPSPETGAVVTDWNEDILTELLKISDRLQVSFLQDICMKYYSKTVSVQNCIERWKTGHMLMCTELTNLAWEFIMNKFEEMVDDPILLSLEFDEFISIISDDSLNVQNDKTVWRAIKQWIDMDKSKRKEHVVDLLKVCCLNEIDEKFLIEDILLDDHIRKNDIAWKMVKDAYLLRSNLGSYGNLELNFRKCTGKQQVLVLFSKGDGHLESEIPNNGVGVNVLNQKTGKWTELKSFKKLGNNFASCVYGTSIFATGEVSTYEFDGMNCRWEKRRDMDAPVELHTMAATSKFVYILGGRISYLEENIHVSQYCINTDSWQTDGELIAPVLNASSVAVNDQIYVFGGELGGTIYDCVQMYNTKTKTASILTNLPSPARFSRILCRGTVAFVVTANGEIVRLETQTGKITTIAHIFDFGRVGFGVGLRRGKLCIYGGIESIDMTTYRFSEKDDQPQQVLNQIKISTGKILDEVIEVDIETGDYEEKKEWPLPFAYEVVGCNSIVMSMDNLQTKA